MRLGVPGLALLLAASLLPACSPSSGDDDDASLPGDDDSSQAGDDDTSSQTDLDGDGFLPPEDCDDTKVSVNPDATESCNGIDDNCDGNTDEAGARGEKPFFQDTDEDTYGNPDQRVQACSAPTGYVTDNRDCDDTDPQVNPDQEELCGDGVDNNCDGSGNSCGLNGAISLSSAQVKIVGEEPNDYAGYAVASAGDVNQDGYEDILVGAYGEDTGGPTAGAAYLLFGPLEGEIDLSTADVKFTGEASGDHAGFAVAGLGDVNGDGFDDLLIGAPNHDGPDEGSITRGAAYLIYGSSSLAGTIPLAGADAKMLGAHNSDVAGYSVGAAGDVNGDGKMDLLIGAWNEQTGGPAAGTAYLFYGPIEGSLSVADADATLYSPSEYTFAGYWVTSAGDINRDGKADILIGAKYDSAAANEAGAVYLFYGPVEGTLSLELADVRFQGEAAGDAAGHTLAAGDLNNDGIPDLLIPAIGSDRGAKDGGAVYLFYGPVADGTHSLSDADVILLGDDPSGHAGQSVAIAGDVDKDGYNDLLIGAVGESNPRTPSGAAYLIYGPVTGDELELSAADAIITAAPGETMGDALSSAGDLNKDGFADILVGIHNKASDAEYAGTAWVLHGGSGM